ncbi:DUF3325 domain-containing protein [Vreelandella utahensis]|uniref:DUF3325 domain-containing protein n=1 Tax=Vreelandella halophila TaxID=86177 RepID=UPI0015C2EF1F|nr:DUF3325 domain-containing protein [Halomonas utahensis]
MGDAFLLLAVFGCACIGLAWLALSQNRHWRAIRGGSHDRAPVKRLRVGGALWLVLSLVGALLRDGAHFGVPLWVMALITSGVAVALTLAWSPRCIEVVAVLPLPGTGFHRSGQ